MEENLKIEIKRNYCATYNNFFRYHFYIMLFIYMAFDLLIYKPTKKYNNIKR